MAMKKIFLSIISLLLVLGTTIKTSIAVDTLDGLRLIKSAQIFNNAGKAFASSEELSFDDSFKLKVLMKDITAHGELAGEIVVPGVSYTLMTLPNELVTKTNQDISWPVKMGESDLGVATYSKDSKQITFVFDEAINDETTIINAYIEMEVKLDKDKCGDKQTVDVAMGGGSPTYSITITENKPKPPVIEKTANYRNDKVFEWTVKITKGGIVYKDGLQFIDAFSSNQEYVEDSFTVNTVSIDKSLIEVNKQTITYLTLLEDNQNYEITYKTKLINASLISNDKVENNKEVTVSNKAQLLDIEKGSLVSSDTKELKQKTGINWIEKTSGDKRIDGNEVYVPWSIIVNTNGYAFKDIIVKDIIKKGKPINSSSVLSIVDNSIKVNGVSISWDKVTSSNNSSTVDKNDYWWTLNLNEALGKTTLNGVYTITYETKITDYTNYMKYNQDPIKNDVSIKFGCPEFDGDGPTIIYGTPSVSKETKVNEGTLKKDFISYDKSKHQMTWKVTFNENKSEVTEKVTIKDFVGSEDQHKIIKVDNFMIDGVATDSTALGYTITKLDKNYNIVFNDSSLISQKVVSFEVISELTDPDFYENNNKQTKEFKNSAIVYLGSVEYSTVYATYKPEIKVLSKDAKGYDYKNHIVNWEIKVNHDEMNLKNVIIEDELIDGLSLLEDSLKLSNSDGDMVLSKDSGSPYYTYLNNDLKVYLGDITKTYTLSFQAKVDVVNGVFNNKSFTNYNGKISVKNKATLKKDTSAPSSVETNQELLNKILEKKGTPILDSQKINYSVVINQAMTHMEKTELKDILCPGLSLSLSSIHLFEASIKQNGDFDKGNEVALDFDTEILGKENIYNKPNGSTLLSISIPKNNGKAYILEYYAYVKDFSLVNYTNDIQGEGIIPGETKTSSVISSNELGVGGGAESSKSSTVIYTLVDQKDKTKVISGAEFTLYYKGKVVGVAITDENGKVVFNGLDEDIEYNLVQTRTTDGYIPEEAVNVKFVAPKKGYNNRKEVTVENVMRPFDIKNIDDKGNVIKGSEFELYKVTDNVDEIIDKDKLNAVFIKDNLIEKQLTDNNGNIIYNRDMVDGLYIIRQLSVPDDYILSDEYLVVKVVGGLVINTYYLSDNAEELNNVIVNKKKVLDPIPNPTPTPTPDPKPIIPTPEPIIPKPKPIVPSVPKVPVKTGDLFAIETIGMFISSLSLLLLTYKKRLKK